MSELEITDFESLTRPAVRAVTPYFPGKPIAEVQRELGIRRVIKLASNENFMGPSPRALAAIRRDAKDNHLYPEGASPLLRQALAREHGVEPNQVLVGNGSDEVLRLLCEVLLTPDDEVVVAQHAFIRFKQHAALMGAKVIEVPMTDWTHDLETMAKAASARTKIVFVASPNNPTGTYNSRAEVVRLLKALPETTIVAIDEAYYEYALGQSDYHRDLVSMLAKHPNLLVLRTFSKSYGLAGLRVGYGVAHAELVGWLDRARLPFNVGLLAQRAAVEALKDKAFVKRAVAQTIKNREALAAGLRKLGLAVVDSAANFLLAQPPIPGHALFRRLLKRGVIVRPLDEYGLAGHVRISIGSVAENRILLEALARVLEESPR
ncbi:MAG TPA: histidinol-phosphate transaminase [Elusimicrobiota bacterium]|nr:histidinol-phosphate transaminase [Elusimicrobiota bacterium]